MTGVGRTALGALIGGVVALWVAPYLRPLFHVPTGGIGYVTVNQYPKDWDYAVIALLFTAAAAGGAIASLTQRNHREDLPAETERRPRWRAIAASTFLLMFLAHDHPYELMETFHEGEHLTPGFLMRSGERPYRDIFLLHGLATDGGLDAMVLGNPPSPRRVRRLHAVLNAATLALIAPIAAELAVTTGGVAAGTFASLCAVAAGQLGTFPWFRLAPLLLAVIGMLRYIRRRTLRAAALALFSSTLAILWSLDTGTYALAATIVAALFVAAVRLERRRSAGAFVLIAGCAIAAPLLVLLAVRAPLQQFFVDSFATIPSSIDAIWSLPAPALPAASQLPRWLGSEAIRYYIPPLFYGFLVAIAVSAFRHGRKADAARIVTVAIFGMMLFRTAAGRVSWSHTRFALPLFGIAAIAFLIEPLLLRRKWVGATAAALLLIFVVEAGPNLVRGEKLLAGWRARQKHDLLVRYPLATGKGIYTTRENADALAAVNGYLDSFGPGATFLDFSGERALYYLLQAKPPVRCPDIHMLSVPPLLSEAMAELNARPPAFVVLSGAKPLREFDGVDNAVRVPDLARWIDANYPRRISMGRFVIAAKP